MDIDIDMLMQMKSLQRSYQNYLQKADEARLVYGEPSTVECRFLQMAADQKDKLVHLTNGSGAEMLSHMKDLDMINKRIKDIRLALEPEKDKLDGKPTPPNGSSNESGSSDSNAEQSADEDEIDTSQWIGKKPKVGLDKVSGMNSVKEKLKTCMIESDLKKLADRLELQTLNSFLFVGPPGCGKTFIINAFVHDLMEKKNYNYLTLDCSQIITKYVGDSEKIVKKIFEEAVRLAPCILFIDEIDGMCKNRSNPSLPEYASSLTTAFLTSYNIIKQADDKEIIFIGATNYPKNVDEAMMDRVEVVYVGLPDMESREKAFKTGFERRNLDNTEGQAAGSSLISFEKGFDEKYMAKATRSFNYRDIDRLTANIKKQVFSDLADRLKDSPANIDPGAYVDRIIKDLDNGEYVLTREVFDSVISAFTPSNKTSIIKEIKDWMDEMRRDDENSIDSNFPNLENHPDYLESLEDEISGSVNGTYDKAEDYGAEKNSFSDESGNDLTKAVDEESQMDLDADVVADEIANESIEEKEGIADVAEEQAEAKETLKLCSDEFAIGPDGQATVSFIITPAPTGMVIAFVGEKAYNCSVDGELCEFIFTSDADSDKVTMKVIDSKNMYGEYTFRLTRGISENALFSDLDLF